MRLLAGLFALQLIVIGGPAKVRPPVAAGGTCDAANVAAGASNCPLLTVNDVLGNPQGGFLFPTTSSNGQHFQYSAITIAFRDNGASADTMYAVNLNPGGPKNVAEISIPTLVNASSTASLNRASYVQGFVEPTEGQYTEAEGDESIAGLVVQGSRLYGVHQVAYDADNVHRKSHWSRPLNLSTTGDFKGIDQFFAGITGMASMPGYTGFTSGYLANVPSEWQSALGGSMASGNIPPSIVTRGSYGPALGAFDPALIGSGGSQPYAWQPLVLYDQNNRTLGNWDDASPNTYYSASDYVGGMAIIDGTRTAAFFGRHGTTGFCYGEPTSNPALHLTYYGPGETWCYTLTSGSSKGQHNYPYVYFVWLYDLNDFKAVKDGTMDPWDVVPYAGQSFTFPVAASTNLERTIGGVSYDPDHKMLYLHQAKIEDLGGGIDSGAVWGFLVDTAQ